VLTSGSYVNGVTTTGYATNITKTGTGWISPGYTNYYATANAQLTVPAASTAVMTFDLVRSSGGSNDLFLHFYVDWNDDGLFDPADEFIGYATSNNSNNAFAVGLPIPVNAPLGDHRLRIILAKMAAAINNPCLSGPQGESEDYKITIVANTCGTTPSATNSTYYITQVAFIGTEVTPPANTSTTWTTSAGYSNYTGLAVKALQQEGEGVNVYVAATPRARFAAWVDWNKDNSFSFPSELVYYVDGIVTNNTTFGFQIPIGTAPGDYRLRIRSYNDADDFFAPDAIILPCGNFYNGETEDYLFTVKARCNAKIASVAGQSQCSSTPVSFTLGATGVSASGFNWYNASTGGSVIGTGSSFATPAISATTTYYVTATGLNTAGGACESFTRIPVVATYNTNITLTFNPAGPIFVCQGSGLNVQGGTSTERKTLVNEDFESGGLGVFSILNTTATPAASVSDMQWTNRTSVYVPDYTSVWQPAISSGFGTNKFALAVSDVPSAALNTSLQLTNAVSTVGFTTLTLEYDIFYDSYLGTGSNGGAGFDSLRVEISTNNTTYTAVQSFIVDQGIGTQFLRQTVSLNAYINQSNLKIRFRYRGDWVDGVAVDNIKLYGTAPTSSNYTWLPTGAGADIASMFIDAAYTQPYVAGTNVSGIFVNPTAAQVVSGADLNFQASLTLSNGCLATGTITIKLNEKVWEGDESADWHTPGNWCGDLVPLVSTSVYIPAGAPNMPVISSAAAFARKIEIASGASLTINNLGTGSLSVSTDFINSGTLTNNGTIILTGTTGTAQNFPGSGTINAMAVLEINNSGAGISLNNNVRIGTALKPTQGNLSLNNSDITISSVSGRTALVSQVGAAAGFTYNGTGRFVVERYIPARRAWRLMTAPVATGAQTINQAWQEGVGGTWSSNPSPGYGTHITGGPTRTTAQGFDQGPFNSSIYGYTATGWNYLPASTAEAVTSNQGWMLFIRGSRAINLPLSGPATIPDITTLRPRGAIKVGTQPILTNAAGGYMVVGNPYAAPINFKNITKTGVIGGLGGNNAYTLWDPNLGGSSGVGAFVTFAWNGTDYSKSIVTGGGSSGISADGTIASSTAFIVNQSAGGTIGIEETAKDTVVYGNSNSFRPTPLTYNSESSLRLSLYGANADGTTSIVDGTLILFNQSSRIEVDEEDVIKSNNVRESISIIRDEKKLVIEFRKALRTDDILLYNMWNMTRRHYELEAILTDVKLPPGATAFLEDAYLQQKTRLNNNNATKYGFDITTDPASSSPNRFRIIIVKSGEITGAAASAGNVKMEKYINSSMSVYPNPVKNGIINLFFNNMEKGNYTISLRSSLGQLVFEKKMIHTGGNGYEVIKLIKKLTCGLYEIEVKKDNNSYREVLQLLIE
jgi:hypothetical protein